MFGDYSVGALADGSGYFRNKNYDKSLWLVKDTRPDKQYHFRQKRQRRGAAQPAPPAPPPASATNTEG